MSKLKIAICISGHLRTWNQTKEIFKNYLLDDNSDIDIFIYTYNRQNNKQYSKVVNAEYSFDQNPNNEELLINNPQILSDEEIKCLLQDIPVKKMIITNDVPILSNDDEKFIKIIDKRKVDAYWLSTRGSFNSFQSIHECNLLRQSFENENNIKYDVIMRTRFDILYYKKIDWTNIYKRLNEKTLILGFGSTFGSPNDMTAIALDNVMDKYCNEFLNIKQLFSTAEYSKSSFVMHTLLKSVIDKNKLELLHFQIGLLKSDGEIIKHNIKKFISPDKVT
jgi:hypothetical protein